jgi:hypothetical protein
VKSLAVKLAILAGLFSLLASGPAAAQNSQCFQLCTQAQNQKAVQQCGDYAACSSSCESKAQGTNALICTFECQNAISSCIQKIGEDKTAITNCSANCVKQLSVCAQSK